MFHLSWQPVFSWYLVVAIVAGLLGLFYWVPLGEKLPRRQRFVLRTFRLLLIFLCGLALLRPGFIQMKKETKRATLLIMFDQSESMTLPSGQGTKSRWELQKEVLQQIGPIAKEMVKDYEVQFFAYDEELSPITFEEGVLSLPDDPKGERTDLATSLAEALRQNKGKRLAGVVFMGDGVETTYNERVDIKQSGRLLERLECPLYTIPFGLGGQHAQGRDLAVENLQDQYQVFVKNKVLIDGFLKVQGYVNQEIALDLLIESDGGKKVLETITLRAEQDGQRVPFQFEYQPQEVGDYQLTVKTDLLDGEFVVENNQLTTFLTVKEGGLRILYLYGSRLGEQRELRRALAAASEMELEYKRINARRRSDWPLDLSDLFDENYDAYLLEDVDASALRQEDMEFLAKKVREGKGLMMIGGYHSFDAGGYGRSPLAPLMPIEMEPLARQDFDTPIREEFHLKGPLPLVPVTNHFITRLTTADKNKALWEKLQPMQGANRFVAVKEIGAQVLLQTPRNEPILVAGLYGNGRTLAFAADSTQQWPLWGDAEPHRRFWRQIILWLVGQEEQNRKDVWLDLPLRRIAEGEKLEFHTGVRDSQGEVLENATVEVLLTSPSGEQSAVPIGSNAEDFSGVVGPLEESGEYLLSVIATENGVKTGSAEGKFFVQEESIEKSIIAADRAMLAQLAELTKEFGGRVLAPDEVATEMEEWRKNPPATNTEVPYRWLLSDTLWDSWAFFTLFTTLLSVEWFLRKKWGLI